MFLVGCRWGLQTEPLGGWRCGARRSEAERGGAMRCDAQRCGGGGGQSTSEPRAQGWSGAGLQTEPLGGWRREAGRSGALRSVALRSGGGGQSTSEPRAQGWSGAGPQTEPLGGWRCEAVRSAAMRRGAGRQLPWRCRCIECSPAAPRLSTVRRPRSPPLRTPVPVRLPQDVLAWLDRLAADQAEPRSVVIRQLLRAEMQRQQRSRRRSTTDAE
jgi:hypothetical protein